MSGRMEKEVRRKQVMKVMRSIRRKAKTRSEFTAPLIAKKAGISVVWFYNLVGTEFTRLRSGINKGEEDSRSEESKLRRTKSDLQRQLKELKKKYTSGIQTDIAGAIRHIEVLDQENRLLRSRVRLLSSRLKEEGITIEFPEPDPESEIDEKETGEEEIDNTDGDYSN
jgi:hypothetical protein